jgi:AcrR family transcriptional regulator
MESSTSTEAPLRRRRAVRVSADERERQILTTAEALLATRSLHQISVDDLASGAGLSRSAFYFYFASKEQVLLSLLDRLVEDQLSDERDSLRDLADDPQGVWRLVLGASFERWSAHRGVLLATLEASAASAELRDVWSRLLARAVDRTAAAIEAERARGAAPPGVPSRDLAFCLNQMNEKVFEAIAAGAQPAVGQEATLDALVGIWLAALYGTTSFAEPATPAARPRRTSKTSSA